MTLSISNFKNFIFLLVGIISFESFIFFSTKGENAKRHPPNFFEYAFAKNENRAKYIIAEKIYNFSKTKYNIIQVGGSAGLHAIDPRIVNKNISDACYPVSVKFRKGMKDGTLVLNVIHGKEVTVEYAKNEIIDKINSFFGYNCISNVALKIIEHKFNKQNKILPKLKNLDSVEKKIKNIDNDQLKTSLKKFLKAYNKKND